MFGWLGKKINNTKKNITETGKELLAVETIKSTNKEIKDMYDVILNPENKIKNSKNESFKEAQKRLNVSDIDLIKIYNNYKIIVYVSLFFTISLFLVLMYYLYVQFKILNSISLLVFIVFSLINAFQFSFRAYQIKSKKLCSVKEWWDNPDNWIPK